MQVLIVDDDDFALSVLENTLTRMRYTAVSARDGREALEILRPGNIRLVITDWDMPGMNGIELCRAIRKDEGSSYTYLIMLTGREGANQRMEGLCAGADDFLNKPLDPEELLLCLKTAERMLSLETRDVALFALAKLAESRDPQIGAHVERLQHYTRILARHLPDQVKARYGIDDEYIRLLFQTSPLHDLGKVAIPDNVLLKPGKLSPAEFAIMQTHTLIGGQTLDAALQQLPSARFLQIAREVAVTHHEKFDGTGYPHGLAGQNIPLSGRVVAVADVYDALTSRRVYKDAMSHEQARAILLKESGRHFDPDVVDAFMEAEEHIAEVRDRLRDNLTPVATPQVVLPVPAPDPDRGAGCKILVVEDDPVILAKLTELLGATGECVFSASDGRKAIDLWEEHGPRVVVSDWVMPNVDGVDLCRHIRARNGSAPAHFIMLTSHSEKGRMLDAYAAGVDDFVSKPFDPEELLARVRAGIRTARLHDDLIRQAVGTQALNVQLATVNSRLEKLSITDELTGLFNRRHAMFRLDEQWALAERYGRPLSIAMIDIDHFKRINDTYGHDAGDIVLRQVAGIVRDKTRGTDAVCRVGGEEFLIILPMQTLEEVNVCAERCRAAVEAHCFKVGDIEIKVTISVGVVGRMPGLAQFPDLLRIADQALYAAKHAGRNVVRTLYPMAQLAAASAGRAAGKVRAGLTPGPVDCEVVLKRCGGDATFAAAVTERFRDHAGSEVGRIEQALSAGDADTVQRAAHSLKSMAAYVSAETASDLAKRIEGLGRDGQLAELQPLVDQLRKEIDSVTAWIALNPVAGWSDRRDRRAPQVLGPLP